MSYLKNQTETSLQETKNNNPFYRLDGSSQYLSILNNSNLDFNGDFSILATFKTNSTTLGHLLDKRMSAPTYRGYELYINAAGRIYFTCNYDVSAPNTSGINTNKIVNDNLIHTCAVIKSTNTRENWLIYVDGILQPLSYSANSLTDSNISNLVNVVIGKNVTSTNYFKGEISKVLTFNYAITESKAKRYSMGESLDWEDLYANNNILTSGTLVSGKRYLISVYVTGDDFSNIATIESGVINTTDCIFIATGTTPTTWINSSSIKLLGCTTEFDPKDITPNRWADKQNSLLAVCNGGLLASNLPINHSCVIPIKTITDDTTISIPIGYMVTDIQVTNNTANAITGGINIGTSAGGSQVVSALAIGANADIMTTPLLKWFSSTTAQTLYITDVTAWNGASIDIYFICRKVK